MANTKESKQNAGKNAGNKVIGTPFTPTRQPSPKAKSAGWDRRKRAQQMMDKVAKYFDMKYGSFSNLVKKLNEKDEKKKDKKFLNSITVEDVAMIQYVMRVHNGKFLVDWFDRNVSKAPIKQELSGENGGPIETTNVAYSELPLATRKKMLKLLKDAASQKDVT